ncbi:hypothetical protein ACPPVT_08750 [Angustibacter sp. McL0619]|uniref:hypothetical protein n=1 Tax=Angustibacter sp. McL0619 TaxID=3415676 RepID=UPI003CECED05
MVGVAGGARDYPYAFHIALDGNGLNGLEGRAGVCLFRYDPATGDHAYKITYFGGVAGGHAPTVDPARRLGFLGNTGQHLLFYDPATLDEADRVSTLRFAVPDTTIKGSTHLVWLDDTEFVTAIGEHLWRFDVNRLTKAEQLAPHGLKVPHAMKRTASGRYVVFGGMDHPTRGEAREVGVLDTLTGAVRRVELPTTCWHLVPHPVLDVFYALSFRVAPADGTDWQHWGMSYLREYAYEVDAESGRVLRHWSADRDLPAHINSDVTISDRELIFCTGGSHTVVLVDLATLSQHRIIDEHPGALDQWTHARQAAATVTEALARGNVFSNAHLYVGAMKVSRGALLDGIYACQLSADQTLLFTANRGQNHITVYDYPSLELRLRVSMPELQEFDPRLPSWGDPRLGFHHSYLVSPAGPTSPTEGTP